ncbi:restriction endonuclease subunit S [Lentibacter sp. XHP0401]|uniref:restriction endonuclease subunit S n=1 Tax=Lentibacter sp. XHP0401 TaxID=2984334 RepID=UPI0021E78BF6|nr:restriction endonuclease subunit S [Lentibacter sp. XHP0401]MCV2894573.1 restriction endonuclease subunit S [Lentibacter sp. XHP0401]
MSWPLVELQSFCRTGSGTTPSRKNAEFYEGTIPWVKSGELRETEICSTAEHVSAEALEKTPLKLVPKGALLVAMYGATVGRVGLLGIEATTNQAVCHVVPDPSKADTGYMFHLLQAKAAELVARGVGGAQPNISQGIIKSLKIPVPPLEEQKRIAGILDQADALRRLRTRALDKLNTLGQAIFHEMFGDVVRNSKGWADKDYLESIADIASGITKGRKTGDAPLRTVPYMAVSNVQDQRLKMDVVKEIEATEAEIARYLLKQGDLLLTEGGDPDKLGRGCLWSGELPECIHQNHVFRVRISDERVKPIFLQWLVGSQRGKRYFLSVAKQTTGIASINKTQLKKFPLLLPPLDQQKEFESRISVLAKSLGQQVSAAKKEKSLFAALQHRAFRGEL